ncbi:transcriptional regulator [Desulfocurvibacter africanus]|uniref:transcriptional regulator n=1 Tax=Desulfocurvibacter africanus TaxID=873 RepID=UPI002FDA6A16
MVYLYGIEKREVARTIGVTPQMLTSIIAGTCAPRHRIEALIALGVPRRLLPEPSDGRPGPKTKTEEQVSAA